MGEFNSALLMDLDKKPTGLIVVIRDVTGRIQTEEKNRQLEQQLVQAQKLESLGALASGIAHDFNNVLGIILAHITAIEKIKLDPEKYSQSIHAVRKATERGASLVKQLLTFARKTDFFFESLFINDIIKETVKLLDETFPKTIEILTNLKTGLPSMLGDATQLHQVLLNLCVNARDAMPYGGKLIMTTSVEIGEDIVSFYPKASAREYVLVQITDTGVGMDEAIKQRVFDPFFTTKETGKGTGLGLALVYAIVDKHKGFIHLESELGRGTTFNVFLPISEREISVTQMKTIEDVDVPGGTETILFVEDEELLRDKVSEILRLKGYSVLTANDGEEAVSMFSRERNNIALTITDLGLAKFGGDEVFRRIHVIDKNAKVLIASGFIDPYFRMKLLEAGVAQFIQKPYLPLELMKIIREVLQVKKD
jgi:signal transduction histidine kinase/ActR/RegA family two-component response regulator